MAQSPAGPDLRSHTTCLFHDSSSVWMPSHGRTDHPSYQLPSRIVNGNTHDGAPGLFDPQTGKVQQTTVQSPVEVFRIYFSEIHNIIVLSLSHHSYSFILFLPIDSMDPLKGSHRRSICKSRAAESSKKDTSPNCPTFFFVH